MNQSFDSRLAERVLQGELKKKEEAARRHEAERDAHARSMENTRAIRMAKARLKPFTDKAVRFMADKAREVLGHGLAVYPETDNGFHASWSSDFSGCRLELVTTILSSEELSLRVIASRGRGDASPVRDEETFVKVSDIDSEEVDAWFGDQLLESLIALKDGHP